MDGVLADIAAKDCTVAQRVGHEFKRSGEGFGFPEITRIGAAVESAAAIDNKTEVRAQLVALGAYLDRVEIVTSDPVSKNDR